MNYTLGHVWTYNPRSEVVTDFEAGDAPERTWFGPDESIATMACRRGVDGEPAVVPVRLRAGSANGLGAVLEFRRGTVSGLGPGQYLAGLDIKGRPSMVALGPDHRIAFTAYLDGGNTLPGRPQVENPFKAEGPHSSGQWVLVAGKIGAPESLQIVADELIVSHAEGERHYFAGFFEKLAYVEDGTLVFATNGKLTASERNPNIQTPLHYLPHYCWAMDSHGLRLLASKYDRAPEIPIIGTELGGFQFQLAKDGRVVLTRPANDCVFIANSRQ